MLKKLLFCLYLIAIIILSLISPDNLPDVKLFRFADKLFHCCMYAGLTFLLLWAWPDRFNGKRMLLAILLVGVCGFSIEILQRISGIGRTFDWWDQIANLIGFFPGWLFWLRYRKIPDSGWFQNKYN